MRTRWYHVLIVCYQGMDRAATWGNEALDRFGFGVRNGKRFLWRHDLWELKTLSPCLSTTTTTSTLLLSSRSLVNVLTEGLGYMSCTCCKVIFAIEGRASSRSTYFFLRRTERLAPDTWSGSHVQHENESGLTGRAPWSSFANTVSWDKWSCYFNYLASLDLCVCMCVCEGLQCKCTDNVSVTLSHVTAFWIEESVRRVWPVVRREHPPLSFLKCEHCLQGMSISKRNSEYSKQMNRKYSWIYLWDTLIHIWGLLEAKLTAVPTSNNLNLIKPSFI